MARNVLEILRALVEHEKSARKIGEMKEAEAFASKIAEMLATHKLQMSDIEFEERRQTQPLKLMLFDMRFVRGLRNPDKAYAWRMIIADAVAVVNGCQMMGDPDHHYTLYFAGRREDSLAACALFEYFLELGERMSYHTVSGRNRKKRANEFNARVGLPQIGIVKELPEWNKHFKKFIHNYRESWLVGFSQTLETRLKTQYFSLTENSTGTGIIHIKRDAIEVADFVKQHTGGQANIKGQATLQSAFDAGRDTAASMPLNPNNRFSKASR